MLYKPLIKTWNMRARLFKQTSTGSNDRRFQTCVRWRYLWLDIIEIGARRCVDINSSDILAASMTLLFMYRTWRPGKRPKRRLLWSLITLTVYQKVPLRIPMAKLVHRVLLREGFLQVVAFRIHVKVVHGPTQGFLPHYCTALQHCLLLRTIVT